jgi:hypothetical protein
LLGRAGSAAGWAVKRRGATVTRRQSRGASAGLRELGCVENRKKGKRKMKWFFTFLKRGFNQHSNSSLNSSSKNRCSTMYATVNSYISFIELTKTIKCLENHKHLIFLKQEHGC